MSAGMSIEHSCQGVEESCLDVVAVLVQVA
jgi:hypothetical protein